MSTLQFGTKPTHYRNAPGLLDEMIIAARVSHSRLLMRIQDAPTRNEYIEELKVLINDLNFIAGEFETMLLAHGDELSELNITLESQDKILARLGVVSRAASILGETL